MKRLALFKILLTYPEHQIERARTESESSAVLAVYVDNSVSEGIDAAMLRWLLSDSSRRLLESLDREKKSLLKLIEDSPQDLQLIPLENLLEFSKESGVGRHFFWAKNWFAWITLRLRRLLGGRRKYSLVRACLGEECDFIWKYITCNLSKEEHGNKLRSKKEEYGNKLVGSTAYAFAIGDFVPHEMEVEQLAEKLVSARLVSRHRSIERLKVLLQSAISRHGRPGNRPAKKWLETDVLSSGNAWAFSFERYLAFSRVHRYPPETRCSSAGTDQLGGALPAALLATILIRYGVAWRLALKRADRSIRSQTFEKWVRDFCVDISSWLKIDVEFRNLSKMSTPACLVKAPKKQVAFISSQLPPLEQSWALMHEIAHILLAHRANSEYGLVFGELKELERENFLEQEREADALATIVLHSIEGLWTYQTHISHRRPEDPQATRRMGPEPEARPGSRERGALLVFGESEARPYDRSSPVWAGQDKRCGKSNILRSSLFRTFSSPRDGEVDLWCEIPAGVGWVGSRESEGKRFNWEIPWQRITVERAFRLMAIPVTNAQYAAFDSNGADLDRPDHPVVDISWFDAVRFCSWLSECGLNGARLPTEEEWEYACRAGTSTRYWAGDSESALDEVGWHAGNSGAKLQAVGKKPANPWGLYDVHGNIWEWTATAWTGNLDSRHPANSQTSSVHSSIPDGVAAKRIARGGSYAVGVSWARAASRGPAAPSGRWLGRGFRVLLPAD